MRSAVHPRGPATIRANLTPMIDMTFLLIVFFVLVSQITERDRVPMDLPRPRDPATMRQTTEERLQINVVPGAESGGVIAVRMEGQDYPVTADGFTALRNELTRRLRAEPGMRVNLRADRRTTYASVEPVMKAITESAAAAGILPRVNLVVVRED